MTSAPDSPSVVRLRNDVDGLYEIVADIQAWTRRADARFDRLESDVSELTADVAGLKADVAGLTTDVAELKVDVAGLKADVAMILQILQDRLPR